VSAAATAWPRGGFGVVGLGIGGDPSTEFRRPDLCAEHGHPGVTYNPNMDDTWCLCGQRVRPGNHVDAITDRGLTIWWPDSYRPLLANPEPRPTTWVREPGAYCLVTDRPVPVQLDLFGAAA